jgi:hypothetical protein
MFVSNTPFMTKLSCSLLLWTPVMAFSVCAHASERKVPCRALPSVVLTQGTRILDGGTIKSCVKDASAGKVSYELETMKDGRSKDISLDAKGNILEIEEQVNQADLPAPVAASIQKAAHGGTVGKVESLTRGGHLVSYETTITLNGKRREVAFRPDGSPTK